MDWRHRAACRDEDPELFFPTATRGLPAKDADARAKAVCTGCPVRARCLDFALAALPYGIAGGLTAAERSRLRTGERPVVAVAPIADPLDDLPADASHRDVRETGTAALRRGRAVRDVAAACRVSDRTVERWAAELRDSARSA